MTDTPQGVPPAPQNGGTPTDPSETDLDKIVSKRVGAYAKRTHDAESQRDEAVTRLQAEQAEKELLRQENATLKLAQKEIELNKKFPLAAEHLKKFPHLGLTADGPEDYEKKLGELNTHLASQATTPGTPPAQPAAPAQGGQPQQGAPIVAPTGGGTLPTVPAENVNDIAKMPLVEYAKLPAQDRQNLLRALDAQYSSPASQKPR